MDYNLCIVRPHNYVHAGAFTELAEVIAYGLEDLGHAVHFNENTMMSDARNILIGCHLADTRVTEHVPDDTIVVNTEQLHVDEQAWNQNIYRWASRYETWDYTAWPRHRACALSEARLPSEAASHSG
ncbi:MULTISPECIES: uL13 family ribosomal protein [Burkholderia cepacia complex]|uniref:uL13 family ribosomal protein n=1 Tax=Burkholderia cepacia complex TaxID=87882 RepID=UPI00006DA67E|nr:MULTISPECIES: uL13 family ribosomal protein [Burkholderia cepacia complex]MCA8087669.1 uL13 family ribosomal protein [Burkholderia cenocepacia]